MKATAGLGYPALACAVAPVLLVAVSCGGEGGEAPAAASPLASPTSLPSATSVPPAQGTVMPISEGTAFWDWIAANSPECEPILQPTYLPPDLHHVTLRLADAQRGCLLFDVVYTDSAGQVRLSVGGGPWFNAPPLPKPDTVYEDVEVRGTTGGYTLQHAAEPVGVAWLTWNEPGKWGKAEDSWHRDYVEYLMSSEGFSKEELLKVANALEPVQP
jgi:hypothetical protein